jgi:hypothetical protein
LEKKNSPIRDSVGKITAFILGDNGKNGLFSGNPEQIQT